MSTSEEPLPALIPITRIDQPVASTARYARKKQAIVAAASEILNRDGVKGMTLASVASRVGLITTSVTYYFKKKEDLAVACFLDGIRRFDEVITEALRAPDPQAKLLRLFDQWLDLHRRIAIGEAPPIAVFNDIRALQKPQRTVVMDTYMRFFAKVRSIFIAPEFAHFDERSITARAHILTEQIFWAVAWLPRYDIEDYGRIRDRMFDIFAHGLVLPGSEWRPVSLALDEVLQSTGEPPASETFLIAATRLINDRGYRGASVEKISARLNVTKGSFYHHNDTKDDLVVECFKRSFEAMRRVQRAVTDEPRDHWSKLMTVAATLANYQLSNRGPLLRTSALSALPASIRHEMVEASNRVSDRFSSIISDGIAAGSVRAVDTFIASQMLTATLNASAEMNWWIPGVASEEAVRLYAQPMLMGAFSK
jgi:AcrR family transcriptional regulator